LLALRTSPPIVSMAEAERIALEIYGLAVSASMLSGERDSNFRLRTAEGRDFVLKIFDAVSDAATIDCQVSVLRHVAEQDPALPVPRLFPTLAGADTGLAMRDGAHSSSALLTFMPGQPFAASLVNDALLNDLGATLARMDRSLRGFFHPALAQLLAWDVRRLPELLQFNSHVQSDALRRCVESVAVVLKQRLPLLRGLRSQAIHGDGHAGNLLVDAHASAVSGILDFGDMIHAPLIFEPAVAMSEMLTDKMAPLGSLAGIVRGYARNEPLHAAEVELLYDLINARQAVTILVHAWRSRHDPPGARILEEASENAAGALEALKAAGRDALTEAWHDAAGTAAAPRPAAPQSLLPRRRRLMGAGAELFYDRPLHLVRGEGVWLFDAEGERYLDVYNNVPHVGHAHPTVVRAIQRQAATLATHTRYLHESILDYAERLTASLPPHLDSCIFVNSGSEANDVAWRIAQSATGARGGLVMEHAYHGITDAVAALTPITGKSKDPRVQTLAPPPANLRAHDSLEPRDAAAAANDADAAIGMLAKSGFAPAAFFIDSALTSNGILDPPAAWLAAVAARVRAAGGLIVADEVQYGLGRSGSNFWGFERRGLLPDIVTLGKPVGNGFPLGVVIARRQLIEDFQEKFGFFSTFGGNAVAAAAGLAVLDVMDREQLMQNAHATGRYLRERLEALSAGQESLGAVRGAGLLLGLEVRGMDANAARATAKHIVNTLASRHRVLIGSEGPGGNVLKLRPPMSFGREHADLLVTALEAAVRR
jgi:4-aminobutyrate aminotransferase-like enzyme/Ser/Thr protein kinase RdoA (MazF antagonist)